MVNRNTKTSHYQNIVTKRTNTNVCTSLFVHFDKTFYMLLGTRQKLANLDEINITIDNNLIKQTSEHKLLGIHIDDKLTWNAHINHLCSTISSKISLLRQLSKYVNRDTQTKFYQGYILPLIDYGSITWGSTSTNNLERYRNSRSVQPASYYELITLRLLRICSTN